MQISKKFSPWQILSGTAGYLSMAIALSAFPAWANEQLPVSTVSEGISFDIEELQQELQELSNSDPGRRARIRNLLQGSYNTLAQLYY
ncbi:hypothetical protein [Pseudanabaena sp. PCC 6802]|uniref:hypothetical protein n=1 Tax=Pseudanabaena sp. PCC 6802 TaxID=118173 RepID=UPI00034DB6A5|nr:hypothetical protein [Pseudanabaena sp. PCC 6802]